MGDKTGIQWTDATWNPTTGCDRVSPGCDNCYALTMASRLKRMGQAKYQADGDPRTSGFGFGVAVHADTLDQPLRWTRPRRIFVNSMSDLFHDKVPDDFIAHVFAVMAMAPLHTFQVLTKRHARMRSLLNSDAFWVRVGGFGNGYAFDRVRGLYRTAGPMALTSDSTPVHWRCARPLPNVWLGVSAEDQKWADIRIPALSETPAAVRFVSAEPLIGPIRLHSAHGYPDRIRPDWLVIGGESGRNARRMDFAWAQDLVWQCRSAGITPFVKQLGSVLGQEWGAGSHGADWDVWPESIRVREFPAAAEAVTARA